MCCLAEESRFYSINEFKNIEVEFLKVSEKFDLGARKSWDFLIFTVSASTEMIYTIRGGNFSKKIASHQKWCPLFKSRPLFRGDCCATKKINNNNHRSR